MHLKIQIVNLGLKCSITLFNLQRIQNPFSWFLRHFTFPQSCETRSATKNPKKLKFGCYNKTSNLYSIIKPNCRWESIYIVFMKPNLQQIKEASPPQHPPPNTHILSKLCLNQASPPNHDPIVKIWSFFRHMSIGG